MDLRVQQAQQWVNATYKNVSGYVACAEDGITGWATMHSLTRGLQHELGITALSDNFGDTTMAKMIAFGPVSAATANVNVKIIVESGLYCKGYSGGFEDGLFGTPTQAGLVAWKTDMGFIASGTNNSVSAKEMKALLTMDAYVLLAGGDAQVRSVQRWMNLTYVSRQDFQIVPCDGFFSRNVQQGLMLAIQYSIGLADGVANGVFGPATKDGLKTKGTVGVGTTDSGTTHFVTLFKAALIFNGRSGVDWSSSTFTSTTSAVTTAFQQFCLLPTTGKGDYQTWCSLLVSTGDPDRAGKACDCRTPLNDARAKAVKAAGYQTVGRYLAGGSDKILTATEIQVILANGLTFFPIYQESNNALNLFDQAHGTAQAQAAHSNALALGLPRGSLIYFAVDYDATADEVRSNIIPYFRAIASSFEGLGNRYSIGVYGSRNICSMVCDAGGAISSFVSGMSTGYSGNLGFPLPANWAFDQIKTLTLASGAAGQIDVDNDVKSGRDTGISSLTTPIDQNAAFFTWVRWVEAQATSWRSSHTGYTVAQLTAQYLRTYIDGRYAGLDFDAVSGGIDGGFIAACAAAKGRPAPGSLRCPKTGYLCDIQHFGASLGAVFAHSLSSDKSSPTMVDFGGWAGDQITASADCYNAGVTDANAYAYAYRQIGNNAGLESFSAGDMLADVDAMVVGLAITKTSSLKVSDALTARYASSAAAKSKYQEFITARFGSSATMRSAFKKVFLQNSDVQFDAARGPLWLKSTNVPIGVATSLHASLFDGVANALADVILNKFVA